MGWDEKTEVKFASETAIHLPRILFPSFSGTPIPHSIRRSCRLPPDRLTPLLGELVVCAVNCGRQARGAPNVWRTIDAPQTRV